MQDYFFLEYIMNWIIKQVNDGIEIYCKDVSEYWSYNLDIKYYKRMYIETLNKLAILINNKSIKLKLIAEHSYNEITQYYGFNKEILLEVCDYSLFMFVYPKEVEIPIDLFICKHYDEIISILNEISWTDKKIFEDRIKYEYKEKEKLAAIISSFVDPNYQANEEILAYKELTPKVAILYEEMRKQYDEKHYVFRLFCLAIQKKKMTKEEYEQFILNRNNHGLETDRFTANEIKNATYDEYSTIYDRVNYLRMSSPYGKKVIKFYLNGFV